MSSTAAEPKVEKIDGIDKWEVENAADTLRRAFEIKANPKLLRAAMKVVRKRQEADKKVMGWAGKLRNA